jgi:predicted nucleic acid-binding protein
LRRLFVDAFYLIALLDREDQWHTQVQRVEQSLDSDTQRIVTHAVFFEVLAAVSRLPHLRKLAVGAIRSLEKLPHYKAISVSEELFARIGSLRAATG